MKDRLTRRKRKKAMVGVTLKQGDFLLALPFSVPKRKKVTEPTRREI